MLRLQSSLDADYELSEFIVLTAQATYPFEVLPQKLVDVIFMDGQKRELSFRSLNQSKPKAGNRTQVPFIAFASTKTKQPPPFTLIRPTELPPAIFQPFYDRVLVTPCRGVVIGHWRGKAQAGA